MNNELTIKDHAESINAAIAQSKKANISIFEELKFAHDELKNPEYKKLRSLVNLEKNTLSKMEKIFEKELIMGNLKKLPFSWGTLYEMTFIDDVVLKNAIDDKYINLSTTRKEVSEYRKSLNPAIGSNKEEEEPAAVVNNSETEEEPAATIVNNSETEEPAATVQDVISLFSRKEGVQDSEIAEDVVKITKVLSIHFDNVDVSMVEKFLGVK